MSAESLLTIELGDRCNNRCGFCPQHHLRCGPFSQRDLDSQTVMRRIVAGARGGHSRLAFTGGEPLVRGDIVQLVKAGRLNGFSHIAVTTNGRMLGAGTLCDELLDAGLNRVTFSLHSHEPGIHDRLCGVSGAFEQLCSGVERLVERSRDKGVSLELHSATLVLPDNVDSLSATVARAAGLGATIHVVQPFIASRANLHMASGFFVPYERMAVALEEAGAQAAALGTRIKPYNIPYCVLNSLDGVEMQGYRLSTHRRGEQEAGQEKRFEQAQFFRIDRCEGCPTPCPGWRIEHYPSEQMASEIVSDASEYRGGRIILPGLDLLDGQGLARVFSGIGTTDRTVVPLTGGAMWSPWDEFVKVVADNGVSTVAHLLRTEWEAPGNADPDPGNEQLVVELAGKLKERGISNVLVVPVFDLESFPYSFGRTAAHFDELVIVFPRYWRGLKGVSECGVKLDQIAPVALACAEKLSQVCDVSVTTFENVRMLPRVAALWQKNFSFHFPSSDWSGALVRHRFARTSYNFVMWSYPFYLF